MLPTASEAQAMPAIAHVQRCSSPGNAVTSRRYVTTSAAILVADDMNAVTGVGAPVYASGVHMWKGAADDLNARPAISIASPSRSREWCESVAAPILSKPSCPVEP